jgi:apolipoprotein N-acyltransferase
MASLARAWPAALSALLAALAFPPLNLGLLVFIALAPWFLSLREATGKGAVRSGLLFGFLFMGFQMHWLQPMVQRWTGSFGLSLVPPFLAALATMIFFGMAAWLIRVCWQRNWPILIPLVWAGMESVRAYCPGLSFPWAHLGTPLWPSPSLTQLA